MYAQTQSERIYGLDALRALSMLLGTFIHAPVILHMKDAGIIAGIQVVDIPDPPLWVLLALGWIHYWRMPVFFLLAGFFAGLMIKKYGWNYLARDRFNKIFLGFLLFFALYNLVFSGAFSHLYHLWFLYYLVLIYLCFFALSFLKKIFLKSVRFDHSSIGYTLIALIFFSNLGSVYPFYTRVFPEYFGDFSLLSFSHYFSWFLLGAFLYLNRTLIEIISTSTVKRKFGYASICLFVLQAMLLIFGNPEDSLHQALYVIGFTLAAIFTTLYVLALAYSAKLKMNSKISFFVEISYSYYLWHLFPAIYIGAMMLSFGFGALEIVIINLLMIPFFTLLMHFLFVKFTPLSWIIQGYKKSDFKPFG